MARHSAIARPTAILTLLLAAGLVSASAGAQPALSWKHMEAPAEPGALALYPNDGGTSPPEQWTALAGTPFVRNVTHPTLTPFLPKPERATGAAIIVAPGGGFMSLAMEMEGWTIARWLADHGIAAFVLKYRLRPMPTDDAVFLDQSEKKLHEAKASLDDNHAPPPLGFQAATDDALAAVKMVRANASRWAIDPTRVGMMGFSAGAATTLNAGLAVDPASRPAFLGVIYGPMTARPIPADAPPMFNALALDDQYFGGQGLGLIEAWHKAGRPVELHAYEAGGHGFGIGHPADTTGLLMDEFYAWLEARRLLDHR